MRLAIRKVMYAPMKQGDQPSVEVSKEFMMSPNKLHLEASLDKEVIHSHNLYTHTSFFAVFCNIFLLYFIGIVSTLELFVCLLLLFLSLQLYYHGETVAVNVHIQNNSNKSVKKIKVSSEYTTTIFFLICANVLQ